MTISMNHGMMTRFGLKSDRRTFAMSSPWGSKVPLLPSPLGGEGLGAYKWRLTGVE
jgi:hypothetical protein